MRVAWETEPFGTDHLEPGASEGYKSTAGSLRRHDEVRCCVRDCHMWLPRRTRRDLPKFCPDHGISISTSPTYIYNEWRRNFLLRHDLMAAVKQHKVESWRLGNESSEDALSWNVFVGLAHLGGLREVFEALTGRSASGDPQLFLWGVEVWPTYRPGVWSRLVEVRKEFGEQGLLTPTEPDVMLRVPGQALVLTEAKFGSPNGTLSNKPDVVISAFVSQYHSDSVRSDPLDREAMRAMPRDEVLEQLCRNVMFSNRLVEGKEEAFVANLVRGATEMEIKARMDRHLSTEARTRFRRVTWEDLGRLPSLQHAEAAPLSHYLRTKTLRLQPAFKMV